MSSSVAGDAAPKASRRRRGEPRQLLLDAARELFSTQGFGGTSTREIADAAGVAETLLFRHFGSKIGLFREALVVPFIDFMEDFNARWQAGLIVSDEANAREFTGDLFDLFRKHRGLVVMLWSADAHEASELAGSGVFDDINKELRVLATIGRQALPLEADRADPHDLATRCTVAMIAGMAVFGESFYGKRPPSRKAIVDELTQMMLHGRVHQRRPQSAPSRAAPK